MVNFFKEINFKGSSIQSQQQEEQETPSRPSQEQPIWRGSTPSSSSTSITGISTWSKLTTTSITSNPTSRISVSQEQVISPPRMSIESQLITIDSGRPSLPSAPKQEVRTSEIKSIEQPFQQLTIGISI